VKLSNKLENNKHALGVLENNYKQGDKEIQKRK
jgi:hypothetical protein